MTDPEPEEPPAVPFKGIPVSVVVDELRAYEAALADDSPPRMWSEAAPGEGPQRLPLKFDRAESMLTAILVDDSSGAIEMPDLPAGGPVFAGRPTPPAGQGRRASRAAKPAAPPGVILPPWELPGAEAALKARRARRLRRVVTWLVVLAVLGAAYVVFRLTI